VSSAAASFYFDLANPLAYLAAERILQALPAPAEWQPVLACALQGARELPGAEAPAGWRRAEEGASMRDEVARRARELDLQPLRWPDPFPFDSSLAMRVATYAKSIGRAVPFAQAAFRQAFAGGHSLEDPDHVLIAAAACEMHPAAVLRGAGLRAVEQQLAAATNAAAGIGVEEVPAIVVGGRVFAGERLLEDAARHMRGASRGAQSR